MNFSDKQIVFEDNHLIIVNKKPGQLVQGDKTGDISLFEEIKLYIKKKEKKEGNVYLGLVHRIDRPTAGLVIFAKSSKALSRLNEDLKQRKINKTYLAIVKIDPQFELKKEDTLIHYLSKNERNNKSIVYIKETDGAKKAILSYKIVQELKRYYVLEINLETGRHHQIRAQLSKIKHPIKGDLKYGFDRSNKDGSIHLLASKLNFIHPVTKEELKFKAFFPKDDLWKEVKVK